LPAMIPESAMPPPRRRGGMYAKRGLFISPITQRPRHTCRRTPAEHRQRMCCNVPAPTKTSLCSALQKSTDRTTAASGDSRVARPPHQHSRARTHNEATHAHRSGPLKPRQPESEGDGDRRWSVRSKDFLCAGIIPFAIEAFPAASQECSSRTGIYSAQAEHFSHLIVQQLDRHFEQRADSIPANLCEICHDFPRYQRSLGLLALPRCEGNLPKTANEGRARRNFDQSGGGAIFYKPFVSGIPATTGRDVALVGSTWRVRWRISFRKFFTARSERAPRNGEVSSAHDEPPVRVVGRKVMRRPSTEYKTSAIISPSVEFPATMSPSSPLRHDRAKQGRARLGLGQNQAVGCGSSRGYRRGVREIIAYAARPMRRREAT